MISYFLLKDYSRGCRDSFNRQGNNTGRSGDRGSTCQLEKKARFQNGDLGGSPL
jgi:hypothetical protein